MLTLNVMISIDSSLPGFTTYLNVIRMLFKSNELKNFINYQCTSKTIISLLFTDFR